MSSGTVALQSLGVAGAASAASASASASASAIAAAASPATSASAGAAEAAAASSSDSSKALPLGAAAAAQQDGRQRAFSPYDNNGGTVCAIGGSDFCVVAADTRMSSGYSILSRRGSKCVQLTRRCVLATAGMQADTQALHKLLVSRIAWYAHQNNGKEMPTPAIAQLLSNTLYGRRFFPYYTFNVLAGLDPEGEGCVFSYDAVGSFERQNYSSSGTGTSLVMPMLDTQVGWKNQRGLGTDITRDLALDVVKDALTSAGERDIYTGDEVDIFVIDKDGITTQKMDLKKD